MHAPAATSGRGIGRMSRAAWLSAALLAVVLMPSSFNVSAIDRAVRTLDLEAEAGAYLAAAEAEPGYTAAVTVRAAPPAFGSSISSYETLPHTGLGGRQGPSFDARTGIPWWR